MITILLILSLLIPVNTPTITEDIIPINSVEIREVETPARFFGKEVIEDDWYAIFWSNKITKPIDGISLSLPKGEEIKVSAWLGEWYDGQEAILYEGASDDITIDGYFVCDQIAVYSTGDVDELRISVCYADIQRSM